MPDPANDHTLYIVHCTDTEGPLYESLDATFGRLLAIFDIDLKPSQDLLKKLQACEVDLNGLEEDVARVLHPRLINYNDTWDKIDVMLDKIMSPDFRNAFPDSDGNGWVYNWFCVDHIGYSINPRRKDCGFHNIFDHYNRILTDLESSDGLQFHFHPSHPSGESHRNTSFYLHDLKFFEILCRRIIDRQWFPSVNRAGFQVERPDSHWLLEQWLPFDISNMACDDVPSGQLDFGDGVSGDWRRAPNDWVIYRPHHDDYQVEGDCRRYIARCLNLGTRLGILDETEMRKGFKRASTEGATIIAFADHDFRDIGENVIEFQNMLKKIAPEFPNVRYIYSEAREAFQKAIFGEVKTPDPDFLKAEIEAQSIGTRKQLVVETKGPNFGPQPFLAIKTKSGEYHHDTFDFQRPFHQWTYLFHADTFEWDEIDQIGIGTNDTYGFSHVVNIKANSS
ncbi:MAG: hypothetical protein CL886_03595 [Dehalococcoidia bacterium]|nr:hypothetical protein [Dehalococcoidia bacterium]|tara:strand:- start:6774 stop:8123 length:1350 start_codon:yes stop_codon:yes gene_type:complete